MSEVDVSFFLVYGVVAICAAVVVAGIFIVLRSFALWYWGINEHLQNQKRIIELLEGLTLPQSQMPSSTPHTRPTTNPLTSKQTSVR